MKRSNIAILLLSTLTIACGVDVTDPQAGYFDDHTNKSGTQNFNNMGGNMEVNINYNTQNNQPTVTNTIVPDAAMSSLSSTGYLIGGLRLEYIGKYLYGTNLNSKTVDCTISYRTDTPNTGYMFTIEKNTTDKIFLNGEQGECIAITMVECKTSFDIQPETVSSWIGNQAICK